MVDVRKAQARAARRQSAERAVLVAAYREGLVLSCITIICDEAGARISAIASGNGEFNAGRDKQARLWCRRAADANRVASAAKARLRRLQSGENMRSPATPAVEDSGLLSRACQTVLAAARRLNVALQSDDEIVEEVLLVVARIDAEIETLRKSGGMKSVNKSYQEYRRAEGKSAMRYDDWMLKYRENLVRQAASALRDI